jgi:hypothetical protein
MGSPHPENGKKLPEMIHRIYDEVQFGYGGFLTEYYLIRRTLVVFSIGTLIAAAGFISSG